MRLDTRIDAFAGRSRINESSPSSNFLLQRYIYRCHPPDLRIIPEQSSVQNSSLFAALAIRPPAVLPTIPFAFTATCVVGATE